MSLEHKPRMVAFLAGLALMTLSGCTALLSPISAVPAHRLPQQFLTKPKNDLMPIDISRLRQDPPREYLVDADDILGIYIEGVLGKAEEPPPVHMPEKQSDLAPSVGYPIPVREDGTLALPLVQAIPVRGLTLTQIETVVRHAYTVDNQILQPGKDRIIVTLMKERTYRVVIMRQDGVGAQQRVTTGRGGGYVEGTVQAMHGIAIDLPAYKNDVLHALAETGGLPGMDAKNELKILKGRLMDARKRDEFVQQFYAAPICEPCSCRPPIPDDPAIVRIPLRLPPGQVPTFKPEDIILEDGDIVLIEGREREVFYTGGLLPGGEYPLPRDYDLDVLGAISMVGTGIASANGGGNNQGYGGGFGMGSMATVSGASPSQLYILRKAPCNGQITIAVDLNRAVRDPKFRPLVQPGDILILQYKPEEEVVNFGLGTFFTYGIAEIIRAASSN